MKAEWALLKYDHWILFDKESGRVLTEITSRSSLFLYNGASYITPYHAKKAAERDFGAEIDAERGTP